MPRLAGLTSLLMNPNRLFLPALTWLLAFAAQAQTGNFYDQNTVQNISLTFTQSNWDYQLDTATVGRDTYIIAASCTINGVNFDSVGVKYKGNSSYNANNRKNPLHIELDHVRNQSYQGFTDVKLSNGFQDPSFVREVLSYDILRRYTDAPRSNFARVTINGAYYGLMTSCESISKRFVADHFYVANQPFFKCNPIGGAGPGSSVFPDLRYLGANPTSYARGYELKSTTGWNEFVHLCDTLNNTPAALPLVMDVDRAIWMLVFNNMLINLDSYSGAFRQNYYLYRDADKRFNPIVWDLNMSFGGFSQLNTGVNLDSTAMKNLIPGANATSSLFPLIQKIWNTPRWKRMYIAHLKTMAAELPVASTLAQARALQALITTAVQADNNKFYTNAQFTANLLAGVALGGPGGPGGGRVIPGVVRLLQGRLNYLRTTPEFTAIAPAITQPSTAPTTPALNDTVWVTTRVGLNGGASVSAVLIGYRYDHTRKFNQATMYDDGRHHDGAAADGVYGAGIKAIALQTEYYVYAENPNAGLFSPQRAEHEFYSFSARATQLPAAGQVVINELLADNAAGQTPAAGGYEDWVELYNTTSTPFNLTGLYLTDDPITHNKWAFPAGTSIAPNGYLMVWTDNGTSTATELHANFKLSKAGEYVILSDGSRTRLDSVGFGAQATDITWGRLPNGTGPFQPLRPTFSAQNQALLATGAASATQLFLYPNPADAAVTISGAKGGTLMVYNSLGQLVRQQALVNGSVTLGTASLPTGIYYVQAGAESRRKLVVLH